MIRIIRFSYLLFMNKIIRLPLPTFKMSFGNDTSIKNAWEHSKHWIFDWEC